MKRTFAVLLAVLLLLLPTFSGTTTAAPTTQETGCLFFTETGNGQGGFSVCDDANANFRSAFES